MKHIILPLLFLVAKSITAQDHEIIVSPKWLNDHKSDPGLVIVQVSFMKLDYDLEHIEGARYLWPQWLAPDSPEGNMNIADVQTVNALMSSYGISNDSHVVLYQTKSDVSVTARMFLMFEYFGMKGKVSFLNGGLESWKKEGYAVTQVAPVIKKTKFKTKIEPLIVDRHYVLNHIKSDSTIIVDARMQRFYDGEPTGYPRDGHITGAKNIPYSEMVDQSSLFKPADQLQPYFIPVADKNKELVSYCFIGQTASVVYLAGRILGYKMKVYDGSMQEWSRIKELPMEVTEKKDKEK